MSWSMSFYAPKAVVLRELEEALVVVNQALASLEDTATEPKDSVSVTVSGYVSWDDSGVVSVSTSQSHTVTRYVPPTAATKVVDAYGLCPVPPEL